MLRVYLETTIPSYLTAKHSRDLIIAARQEVTREWWEKQRQAVELYISEFVLEEAEAGDAVAARERLDAIDDLPVLKTTPEVIGLGQSISEMGFFPAKAMPDAFHIAVAAVHEMNVLLTWNCRHLANPSILLPVNRHLVAMGYVPPLVYTPDEMLGEE